MLVGGEKEECTLEGEIKQQYTSGGDWAESSFKRRPHFSPPSFKKTHIYGLLSQITCHHKESNLLDYIVFSLFTRQGPKEVLEHPSLLI